MFKLSNLFKLYRMHKLTKTLKICKIFKLSKKFKLNKILSLVIHSNLVYLKLVWNSFIKSKLKYANRNIWWNKMINS